MLNTCHISLSCISIIIVILILFHSWPESQSASLPKSGARPPWRLQLQPINCPGRVEVLPPHGAWVTEAIHREHNITEKVHYGSASSASSGRMCRVSRLSNKTAVQIICLIIHTLLKLHLKHFINTEAGKLAIVHVATSFLTIQTLDRPISTFFTSYHSVLFTCLHTWG